MNHADPQVAYHHMSTQLANRLVGLSMVIKNLPHIIEWTAKACFMFLFFLYTVLLIVFGVTTFFFIPVKKIDHMNIMMPNQTTELKGHRHHQLEMKEFLYWICFIAKEILWHFAGFSVALMIVSKTPIVRGLQFPLLVLSVAVIRFSHNFFVIYIAFCWILLRFRQYRMIVPAAFHRRMHTHLISARQRTNLAAA